MTEANWKLVETLASFFGIPVKNIRREIMGVINHAKIAHANVGKTTAHSYGRHFQKYRNQSKSNDGKGD